MTDIQELFSRDPLSLTETDITALIEKLRQSRGQYNLGSMKAGSMKAPKSASGKAAASLTGKLSLNLSLLNKK